MTTRCLSLLKPTQYGTQDLPLASIQCFKKKDSMFKGLLAKVLRSEVGVGKGMKKRNYDFRDFFVSTECEHPGFSIFN